MLPQTESSEQPSRRRFHLAVIYGLWALIGAALAIPAAIYLLLPPKVVRREEWTEVGDIGSLTLMQPEEMSFQRVRKDGWKLITEKTTAWITRVSDRDVVAYTPTCTHLGCAYHWDEKNKNFLCPCHTSAFGLDGKVLSGPAPRALDRYLVKIDGTRIFVGGVKQGEQAG
jgi:menaquinol-cytochrome c reductase iron-sulfur subunit